MQQLPTALTLLPQQARMINASEGFRLEVRSGCLWLTRLGDSVDRFLVAGTSIELHENQVLIQSDRHPGTTDLASAHYALVPLTQFAAHRPSVSPIKTVLGSAGLVVQALIRLTRPHGISTGAAASVNS